MGTGPSKEDDASAQPQVASISTTDHDANGAKKTPTKENGNIVRPKNDGFQNSATDQVKNNTTRKYAEVKEKVTRKIAEAPKRYVHMLEVIMKEADKNASANQIYTGIFLNNRRKKFWVDEKTGHNCFMLLARDLTITWGNDVRYWLWTRTCDEEIEVANLLNVCWLEVHGKFDTTLLTPGIVYEIVFIVMIKDGAYGWDAPVNLRLKLANGLVHECKEHLKEKSKGQWIELKVGEFPTSFDQKGEVDISLFEYEAGQWKRGLIIKGITIRPKK